MPRSKPLNIAFLWHYHQPYYKNTHGVYQMPWVRFHATKDYLDVIKTLHAFPEIKQTFNFVPSLLSQLLDYTQRDARDTVWQLSEIPAKKLNVSQKKAILNSFFLANEAYLIKPFPRYFALFKKYTVDLKNLPARKRVSQFSEQDFRDLQVWYNLTWIGAASRDREKIQALFQKGENFSEADKTVLFEEIRNMMLALIPMYKSMWESGQIELTTSPFYHPILPLLIDTNIANITDSTELLHPPFQHPEDALAQIKRGLNFFKKHFGKKPNGLWPPEGAISADTLKLIARQRLNWIVTDSAIFTKSTFANSPHHKVYQPHLFKSGRQKLHIFFRDHHLSDAISFVYGNWETEDAVEDLISRLHTLRGEIIAQTGQKGLANHIVSIVCDGENCWEYYPNNGHDFLARLYQRLSESPLLKTRTFSEFLDKQPEAPVLETVPPGSRIQGNFNIWIGGNEDRKAWAFLKQTRDFLTEREQKGYLTRHTSAKAWEQIYIAEGSDWCWWYGDEHSSSQDMEFDQLFREHLMRVYELAGEEIPGALYKTIKRTHFDRFAAIRPLNFIHPQISGEIEHIHEWAGAAVFDTDKTGQAAVPQSERIISKLHVGFDQDYFYFRLDFFEKPDPFYEFVIAAKLPHTFNLVISPLRGVIEKMAPGTRSTERVVLTPKFKLGHICETGISFENLALDPGETFGFQMIIKQFGQTLETFPHAQVIEIEVPDENFEERSWPADLKREK